MYIYTGKHKVFDHTYSKEIKNIINREGTEKRHQVTHFSYFLEKKLTQSAIGEILDLINCLLTVFEVIFYIISTYTYPETTQRKKNTNKLINMLEIIFLIYFLLHILLRFYVCQNRIMFFFDFINFVDYVTIICITLALFKVTSQNNLYFLRMFRMIRFFYLFKIENTLQRHTNEQTLYSYKLIIALIGIIFLSTCIILELENDYFRKNGIGKNQSKDVDGKNLWEYFQFHDIIYFEVVTLTTIGFGDITPKSSFSRMGTIFTIILIIAVIPALYSKMAIVFSLGSKYSREKYKKNNKKPNHLIIIGDCGIESYDACLKELYHEDHSNINFDTIIMTTEPNEDIIKIYNRTDYANKVFYLVGNSLNHNDLERCKCEKSICVIILANKTANDQKNEDFKNIMKAFSIKNYANMKIGSPDIRVCLQLLLPETKEIYYSSLLSKQNMNQEALIICVEEIKLLMLGKSCLCPGINTIIASLITSQKPDINDIKYNSNINYYNWYNEYLEGLGNEIYCIKIKSELLYNVSFLELVRLIYELTGFIVIGTDVIFEDLKPFVCLNPFTYFFSPFDHLIYLLAFNQPDEDEINELIENYIENNKKGTIENNKEMVKVRRLKKSYWANLNKDGQPINYNDENLLSNSEINISDIEINTYNNLNMNNNNNNNNNNNYNNNNNINTNNNNNNNNNNSNSEFLIKEQDQSIFNKNSFISTLHPRTQKDSEVFSEELLDHHIVICGIGPNLKNLIMPLRTRSNYKNKNLPILIIDKYEHIPSEIWKEIQYFPDIYYIQGNLIKSEDLKKAEVSKAEAVIILSKNNKEEIIDTEMMDADTIFIYKAIKNENKKTLILADLTTVNAIGFINDDDELLESGFWLSEAFASGELYISSMLDTLICQAFYNPYLVNIINQLMLGEACFKFNNDILNKLKEKKLILSSLHYLKIKEYLEKFQIEDIPKKMKFENLFMIFLEKKMIPIGIFRVPEKINKNNMKFVYIAPSKDTLIDIENDRIYVISSIQEKNEENKIDINNDYILSNMKLIESSNEISTNLLNDLKKTVEESLSKFKYGLSVKELVNITRLGLRSELANIHNIKEEQILKEAQEEIVKEMIDDIEEEESDDNNSKNLINDNSSRKEKMLKLDNLNNSSSNDI